MQTTSNAIKCQYCGQGQHEAVCPTIKAIEYHPDGSVKRVEFKTPADYALPAIQIPCPVPFNPSNPWPSPAAPWPVTVWGGPTGLTGCKTH